MEMMIESRQYRRNLMPKIDKRAAEYRRIQMELVHMLRERICWFDRIVIANAMVATRHANVTHIKEMALLFPAGAGECSDRAEQDN